MEKTYIKDIHITDKEIRVTIDLKAYCNRNHRKIVVIDTDAVEKILRQNDIKYGKCIHGAPINNTRPQHCSGTWVFTNPAVRSSYGKSNSKKKRSHKKLDKSQESVILDK